MSDRPPFKLTVSGCWSDAEQLCLLAASLVEGAAETVVSRLDRLASRCHDRGVAARRAREARA